jgi:xanthine dehydrogenase accessory factor
MDSWPHHGLEDDLRPRMAHMLASTRSFALVTVFGADGGPRGVGAQMVVTDDESWGFVSGGCIEAEVAIQARMTLADGEPRHLVYGRGSPWIDTRLPCGGRLDLLAERILPGDGSIAALVGAYERRQTVRYQSDGAQRRCIPPDDPSPGPWPIDHAFTPAQRLIVFGSDPIALAIALLAGSLGWSSVIVSTDGPPLAPGPGVAHRRDSPAAALAALAPDAQTAIAVATHDADYDERAIIAALATEAGYIGVLGARRRIPDRVDRLRGRGVTDAQIARLRMPIGIPLGAATPHEIAVSVTAEIIARRRAPEPAE